MKEIIKETVEHLKTGQHLVIGIIVRHKGSTPRQTGTRFIIREDGTSVGSIGGGLMEAETIEKGKSLFKSKKPALLQFDMTQQYLSSSSMICGGDLTILLDFLEPLPKTIAFYSAVEQAFINREKSILIIRLDDQESDKIKLCHGLVSDNGKVTGNLACSEPLLQCVRSTIPDSNNPTLMTIDEEKYWVEPLVFPKKLIIFGAGHVAKSTAQLGTMTGFQTTVIDDRPELLIPDFFPEPIELKSVGNFEKVFAELQITPDSFIVILTRSHSFDKMILSQALRFSTAYLGMIGSKRKRETIFQTLLNEGFSSEDLDRVYSPIGLDIAADTPEEIAISIVSQLIQVRSGLK